MRILMVSDVYFPRINGVSTSTATFKQEIKDLGHEVCLIAPDYPGAAAWPDEDVIRVPSRFLFFDEEDRMMRWNRARRLAAQAGQYDVVHIQTPFVAHYLGLRLARARGVPLVVSYHTFFEEYLFHYIPWLPRRLMRFAARHFTRAQCDDVDGLVVPSQAMMDVLRRYGVRTPGEVIPTGMELGHFNNGDGARFRDKLGLRPDQPVLTHVGRIAFEKNIDFLLRVYARVHAVRPDTAFVIAGEGPALKHVKQEAARLGIAEHMRFVGYLDRKTELLDCYRAGDLFLFASRTETQGLVLLESMAVGVPVASTAVMGTRDIVLPERGARHLPEDEQAFAEGVIELLDDKSRRESMGREALAFVREWSARAMAEKLVDFYGRVGKG